MNKKGFALIETVVAVVSIVAMSIPLYVLTKNVINTYNLRKSYDNVEDLYDLNAIKTFLYKNYDVNILCDLIDNNNSDISTVLPLYQKNGYNNIYTTESNDKTIFEILVNEMGIDTLLFTSYNNMLIDTTNKFVSQTLEDEHLVTYIDYLGKDTTTNKYLYRLIAKFDDGKYASINMYRVDS